MPIQKEVDLNGADAVATYRSLEGMEIEAAESGKP